MKEADLITKMKQGDYAAFNEIYLLYARRLYGYCYQYTKSHESTEEVVQDVFLRLWMNRETIRNEEKLSSLLFTMTKHQLINIYRFRLNSPVYEEYLDYAEHQGFSINNTSQKLEYDDFCKFVNRAMRKLSCTQKKVFQCCKLQQLSYKETAILLSLSEQTVKNQLSLGVAILRSELRKILAVIMMVIHSCF